MNTDRDPSAATVARGCAPTRSVRLRLALPVLVPVLWAACDDMHDGGSATWTLTWSDEFEGPAGELPDPVNWTFDIGTDWGNAQLEYDTDRPENVSLDGDGNLAITARRESYRGSTYTSGRIKTQGLFEQAFGRFEARIMLPTGQGIWPAFWMLGNDIDAVGWPECGEIDIMEYRGQEPSIVLGTIHGPGLGKRRSQRPLCAAGRPFRHRLPHLRHRVDGRRHRLVRRRQPLPLRRP